jgi:hypothetical protein
MFSKFRNWRGDDDKNMAQGNTNQKRLPKVTIGVDGRSFDVSNLSCEQGKSNLSHPEVKKAIGRSDGNRPSLVKKRPERFQLYPSGGSIRLKAPSIRDIDSIFTKDENEVTEHSSFLTENGNDSPVQYDRHDIQNQNQKQNGSYTPRYDRDRDMDRGGQYAQPSHSTGTGRGVPSRSAQTNNHGQQQGQDHGYGALRTPGEDGASRMSDGLRKPAEQHQHDRYQSFGSDPTPPRQERSSPPSQPPSQPLSQSHQRGGEAPPRKLTPEEEARRMMEERFKKPDDTDVYQQFNRIAQKPDSRPASASSRAHKASASSGSPPACENPAQSRRNGLLNHLSSKLNLKPSAEPTFECFEIEVSPGVYLPMRGAEETEKAVKDGSVREMPCYCCETLLCYAIAAECIYCPVCSVIGPIEFTAKGAKGVGLGLTQEMVAEILRNK